MTNYTGEIPSGFSTFAELLVNEPAFSQLEVSGDIDTFRVELDTGHYAISGGRTGEAPLLDTHLRLLDSAGNEIGRDEDSGPGFDALLNVEIETSGQYYVEVSSPNFGLTGDYVVQVGVEGDEHDESEDAVPHGPLEAIDFGVQLDTSEVDVYFARPGEVFDGRASLGWTGYEVSRVMAALEKVANVTGLTFRIADSADEAEFKLVTNTDLPGIAYFNPDDSFGERGVGVFNTSVPSWGALEEGGLGFYILTHEILHGLGLAHPHDEGGGSSEFDGVDHSDDLGAFDLNQGVFTTLSFNTGWNGAAEPSLLSGNASGPSTLDIALLQIKYGANAAYLAGDDVHELTDSALAYRTIYDAAGVDTLRYRGVLDATLDLRAATLAYEEGGGGFVSFVEGTSAGFTIAHGALIENAIGGRGDDTIMGNAANNSLNGALGDDTVFGGAGNDRLNGGDGDDSLRGEQGDDVLNGGRGADVLVGWSGADRLNGGLGDDRVYGGAGEDVLFGSEGADLLNGGSGIDWVKYSRAKTSITADLAGSTANEGLAAGDEFRFIENLSGSRAADTLRGDDLANIIRGLAGDDRVEGRGGNDILHGQAGDDVLIGGVGDDFLHGGRDYDTAAYDGVRDDFTITKINNSVYEVRHAEHGIDTLRAIEALSFADQVIVLADLDFV